MGLRVERMRSNPKPNTYISLSLSASSLKNRKYNIDKFNEDNSVNVDVSIMLLF